LSFWSTQQVYACTKRNGNEKNKNKANKNTKNKRVYINMTSPDLVTTQTGVPWFYPHCSTLNNLYPIQKC